MSFAQIYGFAFSGIWLIILTCLVQWGVAARVKAAQPGAVPGKVDEHLSHASFVFRAHRTFMNSLENVPLFLASCFLAILLGVDPWWAGICIWLFAIARIAHMALYYAIATERNLSPRSCCAGSACPPAVTGIYSFGAVLN